MAAISEAILGFIAELRIGGVRISVAESLDAMRAVAVAGLERGRMREALAAALIKDEADRALFDEAFARCFGAARPSPGAPHRSSGGVPMGMRGSGGESDVGPSLSPPYRRPREEQPGADGPRQNTTEPVQPLMRPDRTDDAGAEPRKTAAPGLRRTGAAEAMPVRPSGARAGSAISAMLDASAEAVGDAFGLEAVRQIRLRNAERTPFAQYSELDYEAAREALAPLVRRFQVRVSRRLRIARKGKIDFRRTIRAAIQHGGALAELRLRSRRPRHVDLLIMADISGSVGYASALMLEMVAGARECFRRARSFVFIDHLAEAAFEQGHVTMEPPLDIYARSDFGHVLRELWERRAALLGRATVLVIMGDGRNNRRAARADLLRQIAAICRAVIWLNPEPPERWGSGDSAIRQYQREVDFLIACGNLHELERAVARVV